MPLFIAIFTIDDELIKEIETGIKIITFHNNWVFVPDMELDGKGNVTIRNFDEVLGTVHYLS